uniref:Uncharacterized protein n=1 Tax=Opuntia streptacantha TaxID=393608 RepID=A0A7C8ZGF0_OPUST
MACTFLPAVSNRFRVMHIRNFPLFNIRFRAWPLIYLNIHEKCSITNAKLLQTDETNIDSTDHGKHQDHQPQHERGLFGHQYFLDRERGVFSHWRERKCLRKRKEKGGDEKAQRISVSDSPSFV